MRQPEPWSIVPWKGGRSWAAYDADGALIAVTLYKRGAQEVLRRLRERLEAVPDA